nr:type VI secretion system contractile sheath large subunit [Qingshengfaniella alkalisoli]
MLLRALAGQTAPDATADALATLREAGASLTADTPAADDTDATLAELARTAPSDELERDDGQDILDGLRARPQRDAPIQEDSERALDALRAAAPAEKGNPDDLGTVLDSLAGSTPPPEAEEDQSTAVFDTLRQQAEASEPGDQSDDVLASLAASSEPTDEAADEPDDILGRVERTEDAAHTDDSQDVLADLSRATPDDPVPDRSDDVLAELGAAREPAESGTDEHQSALDDLLAVPESQPASDEASAADAVLDGLSASEAAQDTGASDNENATGVLDDLARDAPAETSSDDLDDLLGDPTDETGSGHGNDPAEDTQSDLDDLLREVSAETSINSEETVSTNATDAPDDLDNLLGDLESVAQEEAEVAAEAEESSDIDDLLADLGFDSGDDDVVPTEGAAGEDPPLPLDDGIDDLLSDTSPEQPDGKAIAGSSGEASAEGNDPLDDLLTDLAGTDAEAPAVAVAPEAVDDNLDTLLTDGEQSTTLDEDIVEVALSGDPFGELGAPRPDAEKLNRSRFRIAILGDFTGRASRGLLEVGDALATRPAISFDIDELDDVIEGFATTLTLQLGPDGPMVTVPLDEIDDLHPDELFEKVDAFAELQGLKARLANASTSAKAMEQLRAWGQTHGAPIRLPKGAAHGSAMRADLRLSDFQRLIGDTSPRPTANEGLDDLLARIVGPHISDVPDDRVAAAVDDAATHLMRLILHHPDFQAIEAQWRGLDMLARRIETDDKLEIVLYDVSADEIAADLAQADDLSETGLFRMLTDEPLDEELGRGGYSALFGLYQFEETPPHAEVLARVARLAAHIDAPFISAISPAFLETPKEDRHQLVARSWDRLRDMPEAGHLGLCSPRFMLRRPYGAKSDPISAFNFEEFTNKEGLRGLLWGNPALIAAVLMAQSYTQNGPSLQLGKVLQIGDMPYHFVTDGYGDQVALPCTERNITLSKSEIAIKRGIMPLLSIKGRDEIRLGSYRALSGEELLGPWTGHPPPPPTPPRQPEPAAAPAPSEESSEDMDLDDLLGNPASDEGAVDTDLDDLLASFGDDADDGGDDETDMDAELQALLEDL